VKLKQTLIPSLLLLSISSMAYAYPNMEQSADSAGTSDMSDQVPPYRGGMLESEMEGPVTMDDPNLDDSTMLEEQMDPNPTLDEGQQILEAY